MRARSIVLCGCLALLGCNQESSTATAPTQLMSKPVDFGTVAYRHTIANLEPQIDYGPEGESKDQSWTDTARFRKWLGELGLGEANTGTLLELVPSVSLALNHGPLFGVERFMEANSETRHKIRDAGFLVFATGPNGDFIVVDVRDGNGRTGWLPTAMIGGMEQDKVREHFVPTNPNLGDFLRASEEEWKSVPKDWYDARDQAAASGSAKPAN